MSDEIDKVRERLAKVSIEVTELAHTVKITSAIVIFMLSLILHRVW